MPLVSRPIAYGSLAALAIGLLWWAYQDAPATPKPLPPRVTTDKIQSESEFTAADFDAHFARPNVLPRNLFIPLIVPVTDHPTEVSLPKDQESIPADLAGGDPNWTFTGFATVDGASMALLENTGTHKSAFVRKGASWLTSRLASVTSDNIVLVGKEGIEHVVLRHRAKAEGEAQPGGQPGGPNGQQNGQPMPGPGPGGRRGVLPVRPNMQLSGPIGDVEMGSVTIVSGD